MSRFVVHPSAALAKLVKETLIFRFVKAFLSLPKKIAPEIYFLLDIERKCPEIDEIGKGIS